LSLSLPSLACQDTFEKCNQPDNLDSPNYSHLEENSEDIYYSEIFVKQSLEEKLKAIIDQSGEPLFTKEDITEIVKHNVPFDYAQKLGLHHFNGKSIRRFYQLELDTNQIINFIDTKKPNAVFLYAFSDPLPGKKGASFERKQDLDLFRSVVKEYDVYVRIVKTENEVYEAIDKIPKIKFLYIGGHGEKTELALWCSSADCQEDEIYSIDISDTEIGAHLKRLESDAVIFLDSCGTARGGEKDTSHLAHFILKQSEGKILYAASRSYNSGNMRLNSVNPFSITIGNCAIGDFTYTNGEKKEFWSCDNLSGFETALMNYLRFQYALEDCSDNPDSCYELNNFFKM